MLLTVLYVPFLQVAFKVVPLDLVDWAIVIPLAATVFIVVEISKAVIRWQERKRKSV